MKILHLIRSDVATRTGFFGWFFKILQIIKMIIEPKYDGKYLHKMTSDLLGDTRVKEALTNVVILLSMLSVSSQPYSAHSRFYF
jgi:hypothetical protein